MTFHDLALNELVAVLCVTVILLVFIWRGHR